MVATPASRHFYTQDKIDEEIRAASADPEAESLDVEAEGDDLGVRIWTDEDEWSVGL